MIKALSYQDKIHSIFYYFISCLFPSKKSKMYDCGDVLLYNLHDIDLNKMIGLNLRVKYDKIKKKKINKLKEN
ncbi:hypothetical protein BpHYR1_017168 [Brachionus plicatilis]|uniref:Uncharacterized protein n=1 Tax=Brachionus plicatilis TaxID=10195 RepID=A0A3M7S723_BRAPC|nr:hypothetical protein BpHYR1_017168 [Brachionus plicatilis]